MTIKPPIPSSLIEKLKNEFRVDSLQSPDWQRGFNEGLDQAIAIIRQHFAKQPADMVEIAVTCEIPVADLKAKILTVMDRNRLFAHTPVHIRMMATELILGELKPYLYRPMEVGIEAGARAICEHENKFGTGMDSQEESWKAWHSVYESIAESVAKAWGLKWKS